MNIKTLKTILAAGALTGIILATVLGLGLRNVARAAVAQNVPVTVQTAPATSGTTLNQNNGVRFFENEPGEQWEGWESNDR